MNLFLKKPFQNPSFHKESWATSSSKIRLGFMSPQSHYLYYFQVDINIIKLDPTYLGCLPTEFVGI